MGIAEGDYEIMVGGSSLEKDLLTKEINIYSK
jgi:hypothetical protein